MKHKSPEEHAIYIEEKLDRHLEIYKNNGKESKRVADALEKLITLSQERDAKVDEMYIFFSDGKIATKIAKFIGTSFVAVLSTYLLFKNIIK
jgi:hypothetical protein